MSWVFIERGLGIGVIGETVDWGEIFKRRPDLAPPGYEEAAAVVVERWKDRPKCGKPKRGNRKKGKWPSVKHGVDS